MNTTGFQNMMGMVQPQGQQATVPMALQARLMQHFTQLQQQMPLDWRSTIQPKDRTGAVMELCVSNPRNTH